VAAAVTLVGVVGISAAIVYAKNRDLERVNEDLKQTNRDLDDERNRVEDTLARSLLRPLGHGTDDLNAVELEALWELTESRSDRLRLRFIEDALRRPETARQLRNRSAWAVHAAVGLDRMRRQRVEEMLLARLKDREVAWSIREECALTGLALGIPTPTFAAEAARVVVEGLGKTTDPLTRNSLAGGLSALADQLEPGEAMKIARLLIEAMGQTTDPYARVSLARGLTALAGWLEPAEADRQTARTARLLVEAMAKTNDPYALAFLARGLSALAGRLEPTEAARAARLVIETMGKITPPMHWPPWRGRYRRWRDGWSQRRRRRRPAWWSRPWPGSTISKHWASWLGGCRRWGDGWSRRRRRRRPAW
jgi:hypothetical protein